MGLAMTLQIDTALAKFGASNPSPESVQNITKWVKGTYWLAPYLLGTGGTLVVLGSALSIIGLLFAHNVDTPADDDRPSNP